MAGYVLIVEKDAELQQRIGAALRDAGYELAAETESVVGPAEHRRARPDAVVLGTRLSDGDGFGLAEELRRNPETRGVPIVFVASTPPGHQPPGRGAAAVRPRRIPADAARRAGIPRVSPSWRGAGPVGDDDTPPPVQGTKESLTSRATTGAARGRADGQDPGRGSGRRRRSPGRSSGRRWHGCSSGSTPRAPAARCCCSATTSRRSSSSRTAIHFRSGRTSSVSAWGRSCSRRSSSPARC